MVVVKLGIGGTVSCAVVSVGFWFGSRGVGIVTMGIGKRELVDEVGSELVEEVVVEEGSTVDGV